MKIKKWIAFILIGIIFLTAIPLEKLFVVAADNLITLPRSGQTVKLPSDIPLSRNFQGKTYNLNLNLLEDRKIVVYGNHTDISQNASRDFKNGEWRWLGYDMNGNSYSNYRFPRDDDSGRHASEKNWIHKPWDRGLVDPSSYYEPRDSRLGEWLQNMNWNEPDRKGKSPSEYDANFLIERFHLLSPPGKYTEGMAMGWHVSTGGRIWYQTFSIPPEVDGEDLWVEDTDVVADFDLLSMVYEYQDVGYRDKSTSKNSEIITRELIIIDAHDPTRYNDIIAYNENEEPTIRLRSGTYMFQLNVENNAGDTATKFGFVTVIKEIVEDGEEQEDSQPVFFIEAPPVANMGESFLVSAKNSIPSIGAKIIDDKYRWFIGQSPSNLTYRPEFDGMAEISVSFNEIGKYYFQVEGEDTAGKDGKSNVADTEIKDNTPTDVLARVNTPQVVWEGVLFNVSTNGSQVWYGDTYFSANAGIREGIARYNYTASTNYRGKLDAGGGEIYVEELGSQSISFRLRSKDAEDTDTSAFMVLETPDTYFSVYGSRKENRKLTLDLSPTKAHIDYPINSSKTVVTIKDLNTNHTVTATETQAVNNGHIRAKRLNGKEMEFTIKQQGRYEITVYQEDMRGRSSSRTEVITITEDLAPVADFITPTTHYRNSQGKAVVRIEKNAYSPDNDRLAIQTFRYRYDTRADGRLDNETFIEVPAHLNTVEIEMDRVGPIEVDYFVQEDYEHIPEHVTSNDFLSDRRTQIIEVGNIAPVTSFDVIKRNNVDMLVFSEGKDLQESTTRTNAMKENLNNHGSLIVDVDTANMEMDTSNEVVEVFGRKEINQPIQLWTSQISHVTNDGFTIRVRDTNNNLVSYRKDWESDNFSYNFDDFASQYDSIQTFEYYENPNSNDLKVVTFGKKGNELHELDLKNRASVYNIELGFQFQLSDIKIDEFDREKLILIRDNIYREVNYATGNVVFQQTYQGVFIGKIGESIFSYSPIVSTSSRVRPNVDVGHGFRVYKNKNNTSNIIFEEVRQASDFIPNFESIWTDIYRDSSISINTLYDDDRIYFLYNIEYGHRNDRWFGLLSNALVISTEGELINKVEDLHARYFSEPPNFPSSPSNQRIYFEQRSFQKLQDGLLYYNVMTSRHGSADREIDSFFLDENLNILLHIDDTTSNIGYEIFPAYNIMDANLGASATMVTQRRLSDGYRVYANIGEFLNREATEYKYITHLSSDRNVAPAKGRTVEKDNRYLSITNHSSNYIEIYDLVKHTTFRHNISINSTPTVIIPIDEDKIFIFAYQFSMMVDLAEKSVMELQRSYDVIPYHWEHYWFSPIIVSPNRKYVSILGQQETYAGQNFLTSQWTYKLNKGFYAILNDIKNYEFRENAKERYIPIITKANIQLTAAQRQTIIDAAKDKDAKIIFMGSNSGSNRTVGQALASGTGGTYMSYSTLADAFNKINTYIQQQLQSIGNQTTMYVKRGENIIYQTYFGDYEGDPVHVPSGERWRYRHTHAPEGRIAQHNVWLDSPLTILNRLGTYQVEFQQRDNPAPSNNAYDSYRRWSNTTPVEIVVYDDEPPSEEAKAPRLELSMQGEIEGAFRINHRVDFNLSTIRGTYPINQNSLQISITPNAYRPNIIPNQLRFSRVFTEARSYTVKASIEDIEGNKGEITHTFTIHDYEAPKADFVLDGTGERNSEGMAIFTIENKAEKGLNSIGTTQYLQERYKYEDNGEGEMIPAETIYSTVNFNLNGEIGFELGENTIKQVVKEHYINGIGLDGYDLDEYRVFKESEITKTAIVENQSPVLSYSVSPNIILAGESVGHNVVIEDDTPFGNYAEYRFYHYTTFEDDFYEGRNITFQNHQGIHEKSGVITNDPTRILDKKGKYEFYAIAYDEDGATSGWEYGGSVYVVTEPLSDFRIEVNNSSNKITDSVFKRGSQLTIKNESINYDYGGQVENRGISYYKLEYRDTADSQFTTVIEMNNLNSFLHTTQINETFISPGIYEIRQTVGTPQGFTHTTSKEITILDLYMDSKIEPNQISSGQEYTISAELSLDGLGVVAYIPYNNEWVTLEKVNEDSQYQYYSIDIQTDETIQDNTYNIEIYGLYPFRNEIRQDHILKVDTFLDVEAYLSPKGPSNWVDVIGGSQGKESTVVTPASESIDVEMFISRPITNEGNPISISNIEGILAGGIVTLNNTDFQWIEDTFLTIDDATIAKSKYIASINIPEWLEDKEGYDLDFNVKIANENTAVNKHKINVSTPINLIAAAPSTITPFSSVNLRAETSKYATTVNVQFMDNSNNIIRTIPLSGSVDSENSNKKNWTSSFEVPELPEGQYKFRFVARTPNNRQEIRTINTELHHLQIVSAKLQPDPALAGDELIFTIETKGFADRIVIDFPSDIVSNDNRNRYNYPLNFSVNGSVDHKTDTLKYISSVDMPKTLSPDNERLREKYTFTVRAYRGDVSREIDLTLEVRRSVLDLIKPGIRH